MKYNYVLSIDLGTSSCKVILFDENSNVICRVSKEYLTDYTKDRGAQQNPQHWWEAIAGSIRELFNRTDVNKSNIAVIGIDTQSSSMIPVSASGEVLHNALIWSDCRSVSQKMWIEQNVGQEMITKINGNYNQESNIAAKVLWFKENYNDLYNKTHKILNASGYIVYKLTEKYSCNISEGGLTQLFDVTQGAWSYELMQACNIDKNKFPEIYGCSDIVGTLTKNAAAELDLPEGIPVVAGSMDVVACALGCGVVEQGDSFISGGTATALGVCANQPIKNKTLHVYNYIIPGKWCNVACADFGGGSFRWFKQKLMNNAKNAYEKMNEYAANVPVGSEKLLCISSLAGQRCPQWDPHMRGLFFGISPIHSTGHFIRSLMEGNAYAIKEIAEIIKKEGGSIAKTVIAGGIAHSSTWMQIFSDVLNIPLYLAQTEEAASLGNMITAAHGIGMLKDYVPKQSAKLEEVQMIKDNHTKYEKLYSVYKELYPQLKNQYEMLSKIEL